MTEFTVAARSMLLPIDPSEEDAWHANLSDVLLKKGVAGEDQASWINVELRRWRTEHRPSALLKTVISAALFDKDRDPKTFMFSRATVAYDKTWPVIAERAAKTYFALHQRLTATYLQSHDVARQILAQMGLIARLAVVERMSASEIARVLAARDIDLSAQWPVVMAILNGLGRGPTIPVAFVETQFELDAQREPELFGDLALEGCIARVCAVAEGLGSLSINRSMLEDLFIHDRHEPYLLILHYQMIILARYDHAVSFAYEFSPRGVAVTWLTEGYRDAGVPVKKNAYLNNAKALLRFDRAWAVGRSDHRRSAAALVAVLAAVESLGPLAKAEVASWLRGILSRYIRLTRQDSGGLVQQLAGWGATEFDKVFTAIAAGNSGTTGIAEQRLVDCFATARHAAADGWTGRGVGDSVFAPNVPRRKCGDCEFEQANATPPAISAYEAHGGHLSGMYVDDHLESLGQVLRLRAEDLAAICPLAEWDIQVTFVAHTLAGQLPADVDVITDHGQARVQLRYETFVDAAASLIQLGDLGLFQTKFVTPINDGNVHPRVREKLAAFVDA